MGSVIPEGTAGGAGLELREAHFPGRAPIDAYGNGGFRFADMSHKGSLLLLPSGIYAWSVDMPDQIKLSTLDKLIEEMEQVEVFLVGTGLDLCPLDPILHAKMRENHISADAMSTGAAVRTYNVLLAESRAVAAALIAV